MKNSFEHVLEKLMQNGTNMKTVVLALGLLLGTSNFSYSQESGGRNFNTTEQVSKSGGKDIETYKKFIEDRNNNIIHNTSETLEDFSNRLKKEFNNELERNSNMLLKINEIKDILNNKYSQNLTNNDIIKILEVALSTIASTDEYKGLDEYSRNFSGSFDLNFVNAIGYFQYINNFTHHGVIGGKNGESTLDKIIYVLNNKSSTTSDSVSRYNVDTATYQHTPQRQSQVTLPKSEQIQNNNTHVEPISVHPEMSNTGIENRINKANGNYSTKVKNRDNNIIENTSETIEDFTARINKQFLNESTDENSLISKKISDINELLSKKFNLESIDNPVLIIQSALKELSKIEKYRGLKEYTDNFSGKFDINFINAYGFVQFVNDRDCNRSLYGKDGALILQSIYDDLNNIENLSSNVVSDDNTQNQGNNVQVTPRNSEDDENDETPNIEPDTRNMEGIMLLSNSLSLNKLNGVTYEDVWNTVNGFRHEGLRNAVMNCLLHNDVIGAQRLLGMEIGCNGNRYPDYVASTKIGQRELNLMENLGESRRYMDTQEILDFMERIERAYEIENYEVKTAYLKFLSGEYDNEGLPYCIISKYDYKIYLFSANHKLLACQSVLTGSHIGNAQNDPIHGSHTTPGGMYEVGGFFDRSSEGKDLTAVYGTDYILFKPLEGQYVYSEEYSMGMHGYVKDREWRFGSQNTKDHRASNGCVNVIRKTFGELINHLKKGSKIYITRDDV